MRRVLPRNAGAAGRSAQARLRLPQPLRLRRRSPWGAMLGGLAAGLGLAWLASSLGLGEAFGQFMLIALLALAVMVVVGMILRKRASIWPRAAGGPGHWPSKVPGRAAQRGLPRQYSPDNVGNDASARPWERSSMARSMPAVPAATGASAGSGLIGSALAGSQGWGIPGRV
jgi:predicted lipid-binding transport protein (Tim44 family)